MNVSWDEFAGPVAEVHARLARIEAALDALTCERATKEWYTTAEVAALVGRAAYTVREWCRAGRVRATKRAAARGPYPEWLVGHAELTRLRGEGLLPAPPRPDRAARRPPHD